MTGARAAVVVAEAVVAVAVVMAAAAVAAEVVVAAATAVAGAEAAGTAGNARLEQNSPYGYGLVRLRRFARFSSSRRR